MGRRLIASLASTFLSVLLLAIPGVSTLNAAGPAPPLKPVPLPKSAGQGSREPIWTFELGKGERVGLGFAASQPGPVVLDIHWQGEPINIILKGPLGKPVVPPRIERAPAATITYTVTKADVQAGTLWSLTLADGSSGASPPGKFLIVSRGKVLVKYPPVDPEQAKAQMEALKKQKAAGLEPMAMDRAKMVSAGFLARKKQIEENKKVEIAGIKERLKGMASQQMMKQKPVSSPATSPVIQSLSQSGGEPLTPILIQGTGFDPNTPPDVYFRCAPATITNLYGSPIDPIGPEFKASVDYWDATQIRVSVPDVSGVADPYNGYVYVVAKGKKSNAKDFLFKPATDYFQIKGEAYFTVGVQHTEGKWPVDACLPNADGTQMTGCKCIHLNPPEIGWGVIDFGDGGHDDFFSGVELRNHWVVDKVDIVPIPTESGEAGAYLSIDPTNTPSLHTRVRWWYTAYDSISYLLFVTVRGPKGVQFLN